MAWIPPKLRALADGMSPGRDETQVTVRQLLSWFSAQRRGYYIVRNIRAALEDLDLQTRPDFEGTFIDAPITIVRARTPQTDGKAGTSSGDPGSHGVIQSAAVADAITQTESHIGSAVSDPTYRIGKLAAANRSPISIGPDRSIAEAITLMLAHDFSQLPVMRSEREVNGMISWRLVGQRMALRRPCQTARDCMDTAHEIGAHVSLFAAIALIVQHEYVLVRGPDRRITGIVTTSDLSLQFGQLAEPFLLLGEIENHIRGLIDRCFTTSEINQARVPADRQRSVAGAANLTYGEYKRLLEEPDRWTKLGLAIDRGVFIRQLDRIREIRNEVMHFDPDPLGDSDLAALRDFVRFLQSLRSAGAI